MPRPCDVTVHHKSQVKIRLRLRKFGYSYTKARNRDEYRIIDSRSGEFIPTDSVERWPMTLEDVHDFIDDCSLILAAGSQSV